MTTKTEAIIAAFAELKMWTILRTVAYLFRRYHLSKLHFIFHFFFGAAASQPVHEPVQLLSGLNRRGDVIKGLQ